MDMVWLDISFQEHNIRMVFMNAIQLRHEILSNARHKDLPTESWDPYDMVFGMIDDMRLPMIFHTAIISRKKGHRRCPLSTGFRPWF